MMVNYYGGLATTNGPTIKMINYGTYGTIPIFMNFSEFCHILGKKIEKLNCN